MTDKMNLFADGQDGFEFYRIPGLVVTASGVVLAYAEARKRGAGDYGEIEIHLRRSLDGGLTWQPAFKIAHMGRRRVLEAKGSHGEGQTVHNPLAIAETSGAVHFLYGLNYASCFHLRSDDDGVTWSRPHEITGSFEAFRSVYPWKDIAIGPGHGIQLRNGRLVAPVWFCDGSSVNKHRPSLVSTIFSDDHGATWQCGEIAVPCTGKFINPNETAIVQVPDGRVMLNARNESMPNRRLVVTSRDGATG